MNRPDAEPVRVGVVGGGFSGAAVAAHLASCWASHWASNRADPSGLAGPPLELTVFERRPRLGGGIAYGDAGDEHLLNVPAGRLSLWPDRPGHFQAWCARHGFGDDAMAFQPRVRFGAYVAEEFAAAIGRSRDRVRLVHVAESVADVRIAGDRPEVVTAGDRRSSFDHVVLALGHGPVRRPPELDPIADDPRFLDSPWDRRAIARLAAGRRVLLVGAALTMVDATMSLLRAGFRGEILAISRRGLTPRAHAASNPAAHAAWAASLAGGSLGELVRAVRARIGAGDDWRGVIDSLRPETSRLWASLGIRDRNRFTARLAAAWDAHRHRCPPATAAILDELRREGRLETAAARITAASAARDGLAVELAPAASPSPRRELVDGVILCTGAEPDPARWGSPLINGLLRTGLARRDEAGLGLASDAAGFLSGDPERRLSILGPARRGDLWESTAVPELARQAAALAAGIAARVGPARSLDARRSSGDLREQDIA